MSSTSLPTPTQDALDHSARLEALIREHSIDAPLPFAEFMALALYAPGLGYYSAGSHKFGEAGDFVTAPELGPVFAHCLAHFAAPLMHQGIDLILEVGGGSGALALEMLLALESSDALPQEYLILELSADLRERQRAHLESRAPHLTDRVRWIDALPNHPLNALIIANELLDAMPVELFITTDSGPLRRHVTVTENGFKWADIAAQGELKARIDALGLPAGFHSEINLQAEAWIHSIGPCLERGVILLIDYGFPQHEYYHHQRHMGTLMCHYRHHSHPDPLLHIGLQDITAHVDFTAMAEAALEAGFDVLGYTAQAAFLIENGLHQIAATGLDARAQMMRSNEIKRLTLPSEMGELFKVLALGKGIDTPLPGFMMQDRRGRL